MLRDRTHTRGRGTAECGARGARVHGECASAGLGHARVYIKKQRAPDGLGALLADVLRVVADYSGGDALRVVRVERPGADARAAVLGAVDGALSRGAAPKASRDGARHRRDAAGVLHDPGHHRVPLLERIRVVPRLCGDPPLSCGVVEWAVVWGAARRATQDHGPVALESVALHNSSPMASRRHG